MYGHRSRLQHPFGLKPHLRCHSRSTPPGSGSGCRRSRQARRAFRSGCPRNPSPGESVRGERANLNGLVLGCIDAKFCNKICFEKLSPRSTQCTPLHRSLTSNRPEPSRQGAGASLRRAPARRGPRGRRREDLLDRGPPEAPRRDGAGGQSAGQGLGVRVSKIGKITQ